MKDDLKECSGSCDNGAVGRLDIQLLKSLLAIAKSPTLSSAAAMLNIPQPTMSLQMKRLEERAGKLLFEPGRRGKPLRLSVHGERLVRHATRIMDAYDDAVHFLGMSELKGKMRLGITALTAESGLGNVLSRFKAIYEDVQLTVISEDPQTLMDMVADGALDARICVDESHKSNGRVLWTETFHWVCSPDREVLSRFPLPIALLGENEPFRNYVAELLDASGPQWFEAFSSDSLARTYASAASGQAVTVIPKSLLKKDVVIVDREASLPKLNEIRYAIYKAGHVAAKPELNAIIDTLSDYMQDRMGKMLDICDIK